jgi:alpha-D-ribose 1-methylphosphonate 5-triphosphate synthase subunit PhnH
MKLDLVHDTQWAFRRIMEAIARPGSIVDLGGEAAHIDIDVPLNKAILLVALTLLDSETAFAVSTADRRDQALQVARGISLEIARLTYARAVPVDRADFVFALGAGKSATDAIAAARQGDLLDPQLGATIVVEVWKLEDEGPLLLEGPGIERSSRLGVDLDPSWVAERARKNAEFPLGVDLILVDPRSRLAALPRTTLVTEGS